MSDPAGGTTTATVTLNVAAVADAPSLSVSSASGEPNSAIPLAVTAALVDTDLSETLSITIAGVGDGSLSAGDPNGDGSWTLTAAELDGLEFTPAEGTVSIDLTVTATSTEASNADTAETEVTLSVNVVEPVVNVENVYLGDDSDNVIITGDGDDVLLGGEGEDFLYAQDGDDVVLGGAGDDTIVGGTGAGDDFYDGGADIDTVTYTSATDAINVNLADGTATGVDIDSDVLVNIENVVGGSGSDTISGDDEDNVLDGGAAGNDVLSGGDGEDVLIGGSGDDVLDGGEGSDTARFSGALADYAFVDNADGTITVTDSVEGRDGTDTLTDIEYLEFADQAEPVAAADLPFAAPPAEEDPPVVEEPPAPPNEAPVAEADKIVVTPDDYGAVDLNIAAPTDADADSLTVSVDTVPDITVGTIETADGDPVAAGASLSTEQLEGLRFVAADTDATLSDSFTYTVSDGADSTSATVDITVNDGSAAGGIFSFESGDFSGWETIGTTEVSSSYFAGFGEGGEETFTPIGGEYMAELRGQGASESSLENFLGVDLPSYVYDGSAIKTTVSVNAGDEVSFSWMYDHNDGSFWSDAAFFTSDADGWDILADVSSVGAGEASGWQTYTYTATASGDVTIGFTVTNSLDSIGDANLLIDGASEPVVFTGADGNDILIGGASGDELSGAGGSDLLIGGGGGDELAGGAGDDVLFGGSGIDTAVFSGDVRDYRFAIDGLSGALVIADNIGDGGADRLSEIELAQFADTLAMIADTNYDSFDVSDTRLNIAEIDVNDDMTVFGEGAFTNAPAGSVNVGDDLLMYDDASFANYGYVYVDDELAMYDDASFTNYGTVQVYDDELEMYDDASFTNYGVLTLDEDDMEMYDDASFTNYGLVELRDDTLTMYDDASFVNYGTLDVDEDYLEVWESSEFTNYGLVEVDNDLEVYDDASFINYGTIDVDDKLQIEDGGWGEGSDGATFDNYGAIATRSDLEVEAWGEGERSVGSASFVNYAAGAITVGRDLELDADDQAEATFDNYGWIDVGDDLQITSETDYTDYGGDATFTNYAGATVLVYEDIEISAWGEGGSATLENYGLIDVEENLFTEGDGGDAGIVNYAGATLLVGGDVEISAWGEGGTELENLGFMDIGDDLKVYGGAELDNLGKIEVGGRVIADADLTNAGVLTVDEEVVVGDSDDGTLTNSGTLAVAWYVEAIGSNVVNSGILKTGQGTADDVEEEGGDLFVEGVLTNASTGTIVSGDDVEVWGGDYGGVELGDEVPGNPSLANAGSITAADDLRVDGDVANAIGALLDAGDDISISQGDESDGDLYNAGTIIAGDDITVGDGDVWNDGSITAGDSFDVDSGDINNAGSITAGGYVEVSGNLYTEGDSTITAGTTETDPEDNYLWVDGGLDNQGSIEAGGSLIVFGDVYNAGEITVGDQAVFGEGTLADSSVLNLTLGGVGFLDDEFGVEAALYTEGSLHMDGVLNLSWGGEQTLQFEEGGYDVLDFSSSTGFFDQIDGLY